MTAISPTAFVAIVAAIETPEDIGEARDTNFENDYIYERYLDLMRVVDLAREIVKENT